MNGMAEGPGVAPEPGRKRIGGPEGGSEGRAPEGTAGPSPAAGEAAPKAMPKYRYRMPYRNTGMGGLDYSIGICQTCRRVIESVGGRRSRTGNHGEDFYEHQHPMSFLVLVRSNSGNRRHYLTGEKITDEAVKAAVDMAVDAWEWYGEDHAEVKRKLAALLRSLSKG